MTVARQVHDGLDLDAEVDQRLLQVAGGQVGRQVDVLAQPGQIPTRMTQCTSMPNARVNRTSPSTMSRMSLTPWRNISVRSMPMPNAKPE